MKAQFGITETILIIGVLVASGITVYQLLSFYNVQTQIAKEEVVVIFAKDLEAVIDKAIATSGDVVFVYYPPLVRYYVKIENNTVFVNDKNLNKTASFSKQMPEIVSNFFEDSKKITIAKMENKIFIMGRCLENDEACYFSLACCSGFCWGQKDKYTCNQNCAPNGEYAPDSLACCSKYLNSSKQCDNPPVCPAESVCLGSTDSGLWRDSQGNICCPSDKPICSEKHCCPGDKPKWCENPKNGEARCMDENEYDNECIGKWKLVYVPLNFDATLSDEKEYLDFVQKHAFPFWVDKSPFRNCPDRIDLKIITPTQNPKCQIKCSSPCDECVTLAIECVNTVLGIGNWDKIVGISKVGWPFFGGIICGCGPWDWNSCTDGFASATWYKSICASQGGPPNPAGTVAHEIGHTLQLCHECNLARPAKCPNQNIFNSEYIMCYGTQKYFSDDSFKWLKGDISYCGGKLSSISQYLRGC
ncbi:MAG: hypothetical protein QW841_01705 [Candidatus Aenigmatarchaeota archaeon]